MTEDTSIMTPERRLFMMECFARRAIRDGVDSRNAAGESLRECGVRLFGDGFVDVLVSEIAKHRRAAKQSKNAYVRSQGQTRNHHCHWPGCEKQVPPAVWGCLQHWKTLPQAIRDRIWATYRKGQEIDQNPSREYVEAARDAERWALGYIARTKKQEENRPQQSGLF